MKRVRHAPCGKLPDRDSSLESSSGRRSQTPPPDGLAVAESMPVSGMNAQGGRCSGSLTDAAAAELRCPLAYATLATISGVAQFQVLPNFDRASTRSSGMLRESRQVERGVSSCRPEASSLDRIAIGRSERKGRRR